MHNPLLSVVVPALCLAVASHGSAVEETAPKAELSNGTAIEYRAFERRFADPEKNVVVLVATCSYGRAGYRLFLREGKNNTWRLMHRAPDIGATVISYYSASAAKAYNDDEPRSIHVVDAHGKHQVVVKNWSDK